MNTERDLQGEGGGGYLNSNAYDNPALNICTISVDIDKHNHRFKGSNDFICKYFLNTTKNYLID